MGQRTLVSLQQKSASLLRKSGSASGTVRRLYDHVPVLGDEVVGALAFGRPAFVVDGTLGLGGHAERLLARDPGMRIVGLDWDGRALQAAPERVSRSGDCL